MTDAHDLTETDPISPLQQLLGYRLTEWRQDYARFELPLQPFLMNRHGIVHGGMHSTLCDTAMGYSGTYTGNPEEPLMAMTLSLNVSFIGQLKGETLICEGRRTGGGARTFFAEASVTDELGTLAARASGVFRIRGR